MLRRRLRYACSLAAAAVLGACGSASFPGGGSAPQGPDGSTDSPATPGGPAGVAGTPGLPPGVTAPATSTTPLVAWAGPGRIHVVTFGSSSCPALPDSVVLQEGWVQVTTQAVSGRPCTMDLAPTTSTVDLPAGVDNTKPVQVSVDGQESTLPPR